MTPLARRRAAAYLIDAAAYLGVTAATIPAGLLAIKRGWEVSTVCSGSKRRAGGNFCGYCNTR